MSLRNSDKNKDVLKALENTISPILVINNSTLKPYVELFNYAPENIYQQPLGSLVGFFEIKEYSQDSAYIVNFLTSVLKKEYYINPKRPVTESLDSALHKVNLALSELAKQGNVEWLGKLHASICVLEKNNAHFSVAGNAKIFLHRNQTLSEISEDLASDAIELHPLKTFVNVSSGRMEAGDRLLITSDDIFHILSINELKKNLQRLEGEKFVQFLKTALSNQLEMIASLVLEMSEAEKSVPTKAIADNKAAPPINVFSEDAFSNVNSQNTTSHEQITEKEKGEVAYTDEKTGHIYIQGEDLPISEVSKTALFMEAAKEKAAEVLYLAKKDLRRRFTLYKKQRAKVAELRRSEKELREKLALEEKEKLLAEAEAEEKIRMEQLAIEMEAQLELEKIQAAEEKERLLIEQQQFELQLAEEKKQIETAKKTPIVVDLKNNKEASSQRPLTFKEKLALAVVEDMPTIEIEEAVKTNIETSKSPFQMKLQNAIKEQQRNAVIDLRTPKQEAEEASITNEEYFQQPAESEVSGKVSVTISNTKPLSPAALKLEEFKLLTQSIIKQTNLRAQNFAKLTRKTAQKKLKGDGESVESKHFTPRFDKIRSSFAAFSSKQKKYAIAAFIIIFIVPLFIVNLTEKPKPVAAPKTEIIPQTLAEKLAGEKNIKFNSTKKLLVSESIVAIVIANSDVIAITPTGTKITNRDLQKEYTLPEGSGSAIDATFMSDLSLVLILTDKNKVISFSPTSLKFSENNIVLTGKPSATFMGTYLTYLYVLDPESNQIYRYPRAEGGFGEKLDWYKDKISLSKVTDMTIDDNIYLVENNKILKFFKGTSVPFTLEESKNPVQLKNIFTTMELTSIYALDKESSRIMEYSKDGKIIAQHFNEAVESADSLAVDEKNRTAYIITKKGLIAISL